MTPEETLIEAEAALDAAKAALVALEHPVETSVEPVAAVPAIEAVVGAPPAPTIVSAAPVEGKRGPMIKNGKLYASVR